VWGGFVQERGGISRHDAVAWGYGRQASTAGVDIIQRCEVTGMETSWPASTISFSALTQ
jgi:sarcosine oxidase subunit beta